MSNEELAAAIKAGRSDLYPELWAQVKRFVEREAIRRFHATGGLGGVEVEDLVQSGFFALMEAVRYYEPAAGYSFLTVLGNCLKTAFSSAGGYRTSKRDPLNKCKSLDEPIGDDPDGETLLDLLPDPHDDYEDAENRIWLDELRTAMDAAIAALRPELMETVYRRFVRRQSLKAVAEASGQTPAIVRRWEANGLQQLGTRRAGLEYFLDENTDFYTRVGVKTFQQTRTSAVELLALRRERLARAFTI